MNTIRTDDSLLCLEGTLQRPRYFPRQLITPDEMTLEQQYFRDKMRRHNRLLHGWGVVCGARVCEVINKDGNHVPWKVCVKPGYILGPYGDEIIIEGERIVDLRKCSVTVTAVEYPGEVIDPWCSEVEEPPESPLYLAVRYKQVMTRPVRVQPVGCGCDETRCEYSRWCDGYEIGCLPDCPEMPENPLMVGGLPCGDMFSECPPCPSDPWVRLAEITLGDEGKIDKIDNCVCRRMVVSFANYWCRCTEEQRVSREENPVVEVVEEKYEEAATPQPVEQKSTRRPRRG